VTKRICLLILFAWAGAIHGLDLTQYPYANDPKPLDYASLSPGDVARARKIPTDYVGFLFVSPCDPAGARGARCLWAFVHTLFPSRVALQRDATSKSITLHTLQEVDGAPFDLKKERQFVSVLTLPPQGEEAALQGMQVNGKSLRVTQWVTLLAKKGEPPVPPVPMLWLAVTAENQERINHQYYQGLRSKPNREVKLFHPDLQADLSSATDAFFVVLGFGMADPGKQHHYMVASRHAIETDLFTATLRRVRLSEDVPEPFDWMGYTFKTRNGQPTELESLLLEEGDRAPTSRGKITPP
jgi:hypothetical protein